MGLAKRTCTRLSFWGLGFVFWVWGLDQLLLFRFGVSNPRTPFWVKGLRLLLPLVGFGVSNLRAPSVGFGFAPADSFRVWGFEPPHSNVLLSGFGMSNPRTPFWGLSLRQLLLLGLGVSFESTLAISFLDQDFKTHSILGLRCGEPPHSIFGFGVCTIYSFHCLGFKPPCSILGLGFAPATPFMVCGFEPHCILGFWFCTIQLVLIGVLGFEPPHCIFGFGVCTSLRELFLLRVWFRTAAALQLFLSWMTF